MSVEDEMVLMVSGLASGVGALELFVYPESNITAIMAFILGTPMAVLAAARIWKRQRRWRVVSKPKKEYLWEATAAVAVVVSWIPGILLGSWLLDLEILEPQIVNDIISFAVMTFTSFGGFVTVHLVIDKLRIFENPDGDGS